MEEVVKLTGMPRHRILYLCNEGLIREPLRKFSKRRLKLPRYYFPVQEVLKALIIADISSAEFKPRQIRKLATHLEELGMELNVDTYLLTNGQTILVAKSDREVIDVLKHNRQLYLLVTLEDKVAKLRA
jgi:DNA-binding transcriptional MerR regulator